jgi:hypothetical protein
MNDNLKTQIDAIADIRMMMDKSSRFISLSGLSGVFAGIYALIGSVISYTYLNGNKFLGIESFQIAESTDKTKMVLFFIAFLVAATSVLTGIFLTTRKAHKDGNSLFDKSAKRLIINLCIPMITGGLFCLVLLEENLFHLIAPAMLIFYGLSLVHASKYTLGQIRYLGFVEIILGLLCGFTKGNGVIYWSIGFGVCHIIYGIYMHVKLEK